MDADQASATAIPPSSMPVVSDWTPVHVAGIARQDLPNIPIIGAADVHRLSDEIDVWDAWPLQLANGRVARFDGAVVWMALTAPVMGDPALRHQHARIRLMVEKAGRWRDCGPAMPNGFSPGACEWSGSAIYRPESNLVELHFTATARRGAPFSFEQRLFMTSGRLGWSDDDVRILGWSDPVETVSAQADWRRCADGNEAVPGFIKAFRDPAVFRDPSDGRDYLVYAATLAGGEVLYGGAIGLAVLDGAHMWRDLGPVIRATGLNHELERPHIVHANGLYYLFWCTQKKMFRPDGPVGPTGLYGMCAPSMLGPWTPINGTGLVAGNPSEEPDQTYAWWVTGELQVHGFVDQWGVAGKSREAIVENPRLHFGGSIAPPFSLVIVGDRSFLAPVSN